MDDKSVTRPAPRSLNVERWLGRREAFGLIAGRCSAADVECLREIRNNKLYLETSKNWDEFCRVQLRTSRRKIDTAIGQLDKHGRPFFHATQMFRLTEAEYCAIEEHFSEEGVMLDGELVAWAAENGPRITEGIAKLRAIAAPAAHKRSSGFDTLIKRIEELSQQLEKIPDRPEDRQRRALGEVLLRLSNVASRHGIVLVQR
jgi:hypothetical protein